MTCATITLQQPLLADGREEPYRVSLAFDQVIPANSFAEGVPAVVKKQNITDEDRKAYYGLVPAEWTRYEGGRQEENARKGP